MEMARIAEVSPQSVNGWFKRGSISKESAMKISAALGVSLNWLLGHDTPSENELTQDERELIQVYRQFPPTEQRNMLSAFSMRLQELRAYYERYVNPNNK